VEEAVYYATEGSTIYARATGHMTALACPPLKAAIFGRLEAEPPVERILLDLSDCEYMDSTFLGLIVGTQKRFQKVPGAAGRRPLMLLGVNDACKGLLRTIGVLGMVELSEGEPGFPRDLPRVTSDSKASARFILDAHEELSGMSEDNRKRFSTLTTVLRSAVDVEEGGGDKSPE
jgi:anti-anti-sigma factor